jgi:hypothetical protein
MRRRSFSAVLALALVSCAGLRAQHSAVVGAHTVALRYVAPASCPDENAFLERLSRYSSVRREADASAAKTSIAILISPNGEGFSGQVRVVTPENTVFRQLVDAHCDALLDALALITAIATDRSQRDGSALPEMNHGPGDSSWALGAVAGVSSNSAPVALFPLGAYAEHRRHDWGLWGQYSLSLDYAASKRLDFDLGRAKFRWYTGRLAACPLGGSWQRFFYYGACALAEIGWLQGKGFSATGQHSDGGPWLAPGLGLITDLVLGPIELGWEGGLVAPVFKDRYFFSPDETVFRPKWVGLQTEFRLGWVIP